VKEKVMVLPVTFVRGFDPPLTLTTRVSEVQAEEEPL
jgi:hypothetical protein